MPSFSNHFSNTPKPHTMPTIDEELLMDAEEDARAIAYIRQRLPQELQETFNDDLLYYFLDLTYDYYANSGILDAQPDKDGYIDIDGEAIAQHLAKQAKKEKMGDFNTDDLLLFVQAQMDFEEENEEA